MQNEIKKLRLGDIIFRRRGSFALWLIHFIFGVALAIFFRRIELSGAERLSEKSGLIFVSNHPNALIDPALLFVALPRRVAFLAKSTLFKMPVIGYLVRTVGALPLYRQKDEGADVSKNQETFAVARELLKNGGAIAIFPEGVSHNETKLQPLKTGAARIALGALGASGFGFPVSGSSEAGDGPETGNPKPETGLKIVPVGLFYTNKTTFRSEALLHFGAPVEVAPAGLDEHGHPPREAVRELTERIDASLREVTVNAESETELAVARVAEEVFTSMTPRRENLAERMAFLRRFVADPTAETDVALEKRLAEYDRRLNELGLASEFLALADFSKRFVVKQALRRTWPLLVAAPLAVAGALLHFPAYQIAKFLAYLQTKKGDFDMASTMKVLASVVLMPLTWLALAVALSFYFGWLVALFSVPLSFFAGYVALRSLEEIEDLRGWLRAITIFFRRREKFLRLLVERRNLFERLQEEKALK